MYKLYENIRELRKKNKWTQEELASRLGYTDRSMIAKIESGQVDLGQTKILEIAKLFGVPAGDLMGDVEIEPYDGTINEQAMELYATYQSLPPEKQAELVNFLKFLKSSS